MYVAYQVVQFPGWVLCKCSSNGWGWVLVPTCCKASCCPVLSNHSHCHLGQPAESHPGATGLKGGAGTTTAPFPKKLPIPSWSTNLNTAQSKHCQVSFMFVFSKQYKFSFNFSCSWWVFALWGTSLLWQTWQDCGRHTECVCGALWHLSHGALQPRGRSCRWHLHPVNLPDRCSNASLSMGSWPCPRPLGCCLSLASSCPLDH